MKYSNEWLLAQINKGVGVNYLFFWGHRPSKDGAIQASCLSQWWEAPFEQAGTVYQTAEHWMMARKAKLFGDKDLASQILAAATPAEAKKLGRQVSNFNAGQWDACKAEIVAEGNLLKFSQHHQLKEYLLHTADSILVEASPVDPVWGIGMAADHPQINNPAEWRGHNLLGYALMEVREKLKGQ